MRLRIAALLFCAALLPACGEFAGFTVTVPPTTTNAVLSGDQALPAVVSPGSGTATLVVSPAQTSIDFTISQAGLVDVTGATVRRGEPGRSGSVLFILSSGTFTAKSGTLTAMDIQSTLFETAVSEILAGNAYVLVTTLAQPGGELRGQLGASRLAAVKLTGAQVTPPVASVASASATFTLSSPQDSIAASVTTSGLAPVDVTAIRLHVGLPGANGNALFTLFSGAGFASPFSATLDVGGFTASPGDGINSFADAINAILAGRTYLDIQTTANPAGEVRSQIGAARLSATLDTAQEVSVPVGLPPGPPFPSGTGTLVLSGSQASFDFSLSGINLTSAPVLSGIYHAAPGANGPRLFLISTGAIGSPILGTLDVGNLNFLSGITSFAGVVEALLTSATYFDVATSTNPSGEIRGQILP